MVLELRFAEGKPEEFPALAAELVRLKVDVIVALTNPMVEAARQATQTIPIVTPNAVIQLAVCGQCVEFNLNHYLAVSV